MTIERRNHGFGRGDRRGFGAGNRRDRDGGSRRGRALTVLGLALAVAAGRGDRLDAAGPDTAVGARAHPAERRANADPELDDAGRPFRERRYELDLRVDLEARQLFADVALTVRNVSDEPVSELPLVLYRLTTVRDVRDPSGRSLTFDQTVTAVEGRPRQHVRSVTIHLRSPVAPGGERTVRVLYDGYLAGYQEVGWRYVRDRIDPEFTLLRRDALAYPVAALPIAESMRDLSEFDYLARVTVPATHRAANVGELIAVDEGDGAVTYVFRNLRPAWRMDFAVAPFGVQEAFGFRVYHLPEDSAGAARVLDAAKGSFRLFSEWFGELPDPVPFVILEIPDGWGSQKDVTGVLQAAAAFRDPRRLYEVYHEVSHFWNVRSLDAHPPRWNEGLASFLEDRAVEELEGRPQLDASVRRLEDWVRTTFERTPRYGGIPMVEYGREGITGLSYGVGQLMFFALHRLVGDAEFAAILGGFYRRYQGSGATTEEFVEYADRVSRLDLRPFFEDWLYTTAWYRHLTDVGSTADHVDAYAATAPRSARGGS